MAEGKILVIDDEIAMRRFLARILQDYQVQVAASGREGLEWASRGHFDVALVDIKLPDLDGMEVLRALRERHENLRTLIITAYPTLETAIQAVRLGAFDYLLKPLGNERVLISVENALAARHLALTNRELLGDLQRANVELERQVAERTAELAKANAELRVEIGQRKAAEEALAHERDVLYAIMDNIPDTIYLKDATSRFTRINAAQAQVLGISDPKEAVGKRDFDFFPQELAEQYFADEQVIFRSGQPLISREEAIVDHAGNRGWVSTTKVPLQDSDGNIVGLVGISRDITECRRAERLLRALNQAALAVEQALTAQEIFEAVARELKKVGLSCGVLVTGESQSTLSPKYLSQDPTLLRAAEKLSGLRREDFSIAIETVDQYREVIGERKAIFQKDAAGPVRQVLPGPAKTLAAPIARMLRQRRAIVAPLVVDDKVIGLLSVHSDDLTEEDMPAISAFAHQMAAAWHKTNLLQDLQESLEDLKRTQAQLLHAHKMEAIGRLAGGVAHDFNNLLTAIMGFGQLLSSALAPDDPRHMDAQEILNAGQRATSLTRQLLAFSRRQVLQVQVLDLNGLVADTEKMLRRLIGEDIRLITLLEPELARVRVDPAQMEQVIMNLAVNARDAMPEGGRLTIRTQNLTLNQEECALIPQARPGQFVCVSVADTGVGMDKEITQHLFEPFFTTKEDGTGLGLSVVYGIVQQHEGWIDIYSEPGQGSTFKVYLPAFSPTGEEEAQETVPLEELQGRGEGILLVEDDQIVRSVVARMLREGGYIVFEATNVKKAGELFEREKERIHLLFSDVVLPDGTGLQLADHLLPRKGDLRVLLSSGYSDGKSQWSVVRERGFSFVQKPYTWPQLLQTVREVMGASSTTDRLSPPPRFCQAAD